MQHASKFSGFGEQGLHLWRRFDLSGRIGAMSAKTTATTTWPVNSPV